MQIVLLRNKYNDVSHWAINMNRLIYGNIKILKESDEDTILDESKDILYVHVITGDSTNIDKDLINLLNDMEENKNVIVCNFKTTYIKFPKDKVRTIAKILQRARNRDVHISTSITGLSCYINKKYNNTAMPYALYR